MSTSASTGEEEPCAFAKLWGQLDGVPFHRYVTALPTTLGRGSTATEGARKPAGFIDLGRSKSLSREHATISWVPSQKAYQITCMSKNGMVVAGSYHAKGGVEKLVSRAAIRLGPASMYFLLPEREAQPAPAPVKAPAVPRTESQTAAPPENGKEAVPASTLPAPSNADRTPAASTAPAASTVPPGQQSTQAANGAKTTGSAATTTAVSFNDMITQAFRSRELSAAGAANGLSSGELQNWIMQAYPEWSTEGARMKELATGIESALTENFVLRGGDRWTEVSLEHSAKRAKLSASSHNGMPAATTTAPPPSPAAPAALAGATIGTPANSAGAGTVAGLTPAAAAPIDVGGGPVSGGMLSGVAAITGVPAERSGIGTNG